MIRKVRVTVLTGGFSNERDISLMTATQIARALSRKKYTVAIIDIKSPLDAFKKILALRADIAYIAIHGAFGEDGTLQALLELRGVPYTGSGVAASAIAMDKRLCLELVEAAAIRTPRRVVLLKANSGIQALPTTVAKKIGFPCVVKPNASGSSVGVQIVQVKKDLSAAVSRAFKEDATIIIEQYIKGREFSCGVLGNSGQKLIALPPIEIVVSDREFFDYTAKYFSQKTKELCPAPITPRQSKEIETLSKRAHELLSCDGLTRSDFILNTKDNKFYFLEINTVPGQTEASLCPKEARAAGMTFSVFLEKQIELALKNKRFTKLAK